VNGLKRDDLGQRDVGLGEQLVEVSGVVVTKQVLGHAAVADAVDHRRVVARVRKHLTLFTRTNERTTAQRTC